MMNFGVRGIVALAVATASAGSPAFAQDRPVLGPAIGYEFSVPLFLQRAPGAINHEPTFDGRGTSASHTVQFGVHYLNPSLFGFAGVSSRLLLGVTSGWFQSEPYVPGAVDEQFGTGEPRRLEVEGLAGAVQLDVGARVSVGGSLNLGIGLWTLLRFAERYTRSEYLISPLNEEYQTPGADLDPSAGGVPAAVGPSVSVDAWIPVGNGMSLLAQLGSRLDLVGLRRGLGLSSLTLSPSLALFFAGESRVDTLVPVARVDTVYLPAPAATARRSASNIESAPPTASVDIFGVAASGPQQGVRISPVDLVRRVFVSVPRVIPFDRETDLPTPGLRRLSASDASLFDAGSLTGQDHLNHAREALNILGLRLRGNGTAVVVLAGGVAAGEPASAGKRRAQWVADYLTGVWGIEASRVRTVAPAGVSEPVVAVSGPEELFVSPHVSQWRERSGELPEIGLERTISAPAGLQRWELQVFHGTRALVQLTNLDESAAGLDLRFIGERRPDDALIARLTVVDSLGRSITAEDRLPLLRTSGSGGARSRSEVVDALIPVTIDGELGEAYRPMIGVVRRALRDGARVRVAPLGWHPAWLGRDGGIALASRVGREILDIARAAGIPLGRLTVDRHNDDPTITPAIAVRVEADSQAD